MKKKKKVIIIVILLILLFLIIVLFVANNAYKRKDYVRLRSTAWTRTRDEYVSTKLIEYPGDPMPNEAIVFNDKKLTICSYDISNDNNEEKESNLSIAGNDIIEEEKDDGVSCLDYKYTWKNDKIIIDRYGKEIIYTFKFNDNDELVLTYKGEDYYFIFYYSAALG